VSKEQSGRQDEDQRKHENALIPAQYAGDDLHDLAEKQGAQSGHAAMSQARKTSVQTLFSEGSFPLGSIVFIVDGYPEKPACASKITRG